MNGAYNGIGRSTGAIIGGKLQAEVGTRSTFLYGAILNGSLAVLLGLFTNFGALWDIGKLKKEAIAEDSESEKKMQ